MTGFFGIVGWAVRPGAGVIKLGEPTNVVVLKSPGPPSQKGGRRPPFWLVSGLHNRLLARLRWVRVLPRMGKGARDGPPLRTHCLL